MHRSRCLFHRLRSLRSTGLALVLAAGCCLSATAAPALTGATVIGLKGQVELSRAGATARDPALTNQVLQAGDRLRTAEHSRATLRLRTATIVPVD